MADRYWVGGTASWDGTAGTKWAATSGGAGGQSVPTSADNVFFDAASGANTVTIAATADCDNLNFTGFTGTIAGSSALNVYGSLTLSTGMTRTYSGTLTMRATATGKTITSNGKTLANITFAGAGGGWTLQDAFTTTAAITHTNGTLDTNGVAVSCTNYSNTGTATRTLTLGSSTFTCTGNSGWSVGSATGMTLNAGTSTVQLSSVGTSCSFSGAGLTYYNLDYTGASSPIDCAISGANTFNNLSVTAPSSAGIKNLIFSDNQTINGTLTVAGASLVQRIFLRSSTLGTARTLTAAALSGNNADYRDITIAGGAAGSSPTGAGNCEGNSGITFPTAKTVYWNLAGTQNWSATGWATSSGGTPAAANFPLAQDTAVFDNTGAAGTVTVDYAWAVGTLDMSARTSAVNFYFFGSTRPLGVYGNLTLGTGVAFSVADSGEFTFSKRSGTQTVTSSGVQIQSRIAVDNLTGKVQLADNLTMGTSATTNGQILLRSGEFDAVTYDLTIGGLNLSGSVTKTLSMGTGTWTLGGTGNVWIWIATGSTLVKGTANIILSDTSASARTFAGGGQTYNKLTIGGATGVSTLTITGSNTFSEIASTKTVAHTITFTSGTTTTVTDWTVNGGVGRVVSIRASTSGTRATLAKAGGGTVTIDYANIQDSTASPAATWYATNSTDSGNNLNWTFGAPSTAAFLMFFM